MIPTPRSHYEKDRWCLETQSKDTEETPCDRMERQTCEVSTGSLSVHTFSSQSGTAKRSQEMRASSTCTLHTLSLGAPLSNGCCVLREVCSILVSTFWQITQLPRALSPPVKWVSLAMSPLRKHKSALY